MPEITNKLLLEKLDARFNGFPEFRFKLTIHSNGTPSYRAARLRDFCIVRDWCWHQWGPSCEWDIWRQVAGNHHWCWDTADARMRILVRGTEEAALVSMTF